MEPTKISVTNLVENNGTVSATVTVTNPFGEIETFEISTNKQSEGLWINGQQTLGTGQFSLRCSLAAARGRIVRYFNPKE